MVDWEMDHFNNNYEDEGIMHRLAIKANLKETPDVYHDEDKWNRSSFEENVSDGYIIHVRRKMKNTPGRPSPKQDKILNYRKLVEKGILEWKWWLQEWQALSAFILPFDFNKLVIKYKALTTSIAIMILNSSTRERVS